MTRGVCFIIFKHMISPYLGKYITINVNFMLKYTFECCKYLKVNRIIKDRERIIKSYPKYEKGVISNLYSSEIVILLRKVHGSKKLGKLLP